MARAYVGTCGWTNLGLQLEDVARSFGAVEINGSFYKQIAPATYARWYDATPPAFRFALKAHRFVTHYKRLRACESSIELLRDQARPLRDKLAVDVPRLDAFCAALDNLWPARHAIELRHGSWFRDDVARTLARWRIAACWSDAPDFPMWRAVTASFVYIRLHGHTRTYASSYAERNLRGWARTIDQLVARGLDVHVYFDNDAEGHAFGDALRLDALVAKSRHDSLHG